MHEWRLARALARELTRAAAVHGAARIYAAKVRISAVAGVSPENLRRQFGIAAAAGVAEGARLEIEVVDELIPDRSEGIYIESIDIEEQDSGGTQGNRR
jgi:Zn finger protein HypA/HybF involved in hydrogenase expression